MTAPYCAAPLARACSLVLLLLALGCSTFNVPQGYELKDFTPKGILAVGFTFEERAENGSWYYRRLDQKGKGAINFWTNRDPATWENPFGRLAIIELDPGEYELYDWAGGSVEPRTYFSIPFSIAAGRVTYLGRLHLTISSDRKAYHVHPVNGFDEDRTLLQSRIVGLSGDRIDKPEVCVAACRTGECAKPSRWPLVPLMAPGVVRLERQD